MGNRRGLCRGERGWEGPGRGQTGTETAWGNWYSTGKTEAEERDGGTLRPLPAGGPHVAQLLREEPPPPTTPAIRCPCGAVLGAALGLPPGPHRGSAYIPSPALFPQGPGLNPLLFSLPCTRAEPPGLGLSPPLREQAALGWESAAPDPVARGEAGTHYCPEAEPTRAARLGA